MPAAPPSDPEIYLLEPLDGSESPPPYTDADTGPCKPGISSSLRSTLAGFFATLGKLQTKDVLLPLLLLLVGTILVNSGPPLEESVVATPGNATGNATGIGHGDESPDRIKNLTKAFQEAQSNAVEDWVLHRNSTAPNNATPPAVADDEGDALFAWPDEVAKPDLLRSLATMMFFTAVLFSLMGVYGVLLGDEGFR